MIIGGAQILREYAGSTVFRRSRMVLPCFCGKRCGKCGKHGFPPFPSRSHAVRKRAGSTKPPVGGLCFRPQAASKIDHHQSKIGTWKMSDEMGITDGIRWVRSRTTGEITHIDFDPEMKAAMAAFHAVVCEHESTQTMRVTVASGAVQVRKCCLNCGARVGNPEKQTDLVWVAALPMQTTDTEKRYESERREELYQLMTRHAARQSSGRHAADTFYQEYLKSPEWERIRQKVIARCGNVCEGCGDRDVEHVHHMTYEHLGSEFLFELLGLCTGCHDRVHGRPVRAIR